MNNKDAMIKICDMADVWRKLQAEHNDGQFTDDQFDLVTLVTLDSIRKIIAESEKA